MSARALECPLPAGRPPRRQAGERAHLLRRSGQGRGLRRGAARRGKHRRSRRHGRRDPRYMAPEQANGAAPSPATDVYGVGVVLYEMLAGRPPFDGVTAVELLHRHLHDAPPALPAHVPSELRRVVARALAKEQAERFADGDEMARALVRARAEIDERELVRHRRGTGAAGGSRVARPAAGGSRHHLRRPRGRAARRRTQTRRRRPAIRFRRPGWRRRIRPGATSIPPVGVAGSRCSDSWCSSSWAWLRRQSCSRPGTPAFRTFTG